MDDVASTKSWDIPYAGSSSEWKIPETPASLAELANSLPNLGSCAPLGSKTLEPSFPENPGTDIASTEWPFSREDETKSDEHERNTSERSNVFIGMIFEAARATLFSTGIASSSRFGGKGGREALARISFASR